MGWGSEIGKQVKEIYTDLVSTKTRLEYLDKRLEKVEECCEKIGLKVERATADMAHLPTQLNNKFLEFENRTLKSLIPPEK